MIYLASKSPRRQELLRQIGVEFDELRLREAAGRRCDVRERPRPDEEALTYVRRIATAKAKAGWRRAQQRGLPSRPVLGADTEVVLDGRIFGKPATARAAAGMLEALSGRRHDVLTAVAVCRERRVEVVVSASVVTLRRLSVAEIERYVATSEPFDKAGGYAIQGRAAMFVRRLEGSYSGVMGLPLYETAHLLARFDCTVL